MSAAFTPSRNTLLCGEVRAEAQNGRIASTMSGNCAPHSYDWHPAMDHPMTSAMRSTPSASVSSRCWQATLSWRVTAGKRGPSKGGGVLLGEDDRPLPNMLTDTMKYRDGSRAGTARR